MRKKTWMAACLCLIVLSAAGCTKAQDLTEEEQDVIAEYAADTLLKYDKGYNSKYQEDALLQAKNDAKAAMESGKKQTKEPENKKTQPPKKTEAPKKTESPTPTPEPIPTPEQPAETIPAPQVTTAPQIQVPNQNENRMSPYDMGKLFGIEGVEVNYVGFEALDEYPALPDDQLAFTMKASQGSKLLVIKFDLINHSSSTKACNIVGQNMKFQMRFNNKDFVGVQKTLLADDFAAMNCILQAEEVKRAVVICQVAAGYEKTISSVDLIARIGGENTMLNLQ